jgi:hypothetical protein
MNRRSMLTSAMAACAAILFPWRSAECAKINVDPLVTKMRKMWRRTKVITPHSRMVQIRRIEQMIERIYREEERSSQEIRRFALEKGYPVAIYYNNVTVRGDALSSDVISIWVDARSPDEDGLYRCGMVMLTASLAESMDDDNLLHNLKHSLFVATISPYVSRQGLLEEFKGKPVVLNRATTSKRRTLAQEIRMRLGAEENTG